jgi:hypothetical protein
MRGLQRHEQGVVLEPVGLGLGPGGEGGMLAGVVLGDEAGIGLAQPRVAPGHHPSEVHTMGIEAAFGQGGCREPALRHQAFQRDHQRAAGEGRTLW